jgi:glycosyltransferase involved in cell wall biosynthesis
LRDIPGLRVRPTHFAPGLRGRSVQGVLKSLQSARAFPKDFSDLRRYVRANRIRLIHGGDHPRDAVYGVALGKSTSAKSIVHVHVKWANHYSAPAKWAVRSADAIFGISNYVTGTVVSMGRPARDIHTVLNCVDVSKWDPSTDPSGVRRELGIAPDAPLIASVSRLFSWKGQRELLQSFAVLRAEFPTLKLLIVGADEREAHVGSFTEELKALAQSLGVREHVVFTGARTDIPSIMAACDVFTLPSFEEPFGLVFLEAMAMRRPVAALDNGGTPEVVEHGKSGLLSAPYDIAAYATNVATLLRDPALRARMGEHGRKRVVEYFNAERMAADAAAAYEKILLA